MECVIYGEMCYFECPSHSCGTLIELENEHLQNQEDDGNDLAPAGFACLSLTDTPPEADDEDLQMEIDDFFKRWADESSSE